MQCRLCQVFPQSLLSPAQVCPVGSEPKEAGGGKGRGKMRRGGGALLQVALTPQFPFWSPAGALSSSGTDGLLSRPRPSINVPEWDSCSEQSLDL